MDRIENNNFFYICLYRVVSKDEEIFIVGKVTNNGFFQYENICDSNIFLCPLSALPFSKEELRCLNVYSPKLQHLKVNSLWKLSNTAGTDPSFRFRFESIAIRKNIVYAGGQFFIGDFNRFTFNSIKMIDLLNKYEPLPVSE